MDYAQTFPVDDPSSTAGGYSLKKQIDGHVAMTNNPQQFLSFSNQEEKSKWLRETFVTEIWPKLRINYKAMVNDLKGFLQNRLTEQGLSSEVLGRAKTVDSLRQSLARREKNLWEQKHRYFEDFNDIFQAMHDLAGLRIVLLYPDDLKRAREFIESTFQSQKPPAHFQPDREVGQHWKRPWFGAYETYNYRLTLRDNEPSTIAQYASVMFEVQVTTLAEDLYNRLAHDLLYKSIPGGLTSQDEMVIDLSHGLGRCYELCVRILKDKLNARNENLEEAEGNELEFTQMNQDLGPKTSNEAKVALRKFVENIKSSEIGVHWESLSRRIESTLRQIGSEYAQASADIDLRKRRNRVLKELSTLPYKDRKDRNPQPVQGTCVWFTNHEIFRQWRDDELSSLLWVSADPGCGKSVLARHLVDNVLPTSYARTTCYFFFKDDFEDQKDIASALRCILHQVFYQRELLLSDGILQRFEKDKTLCMSFVGLWDILMNIMSSGNTGEIVCVLDALDECRENERTRLIESLKGFYSSKHNGYPLKFVITTRPHLPIIRDFQTRSQRIIRLDGDDRVEEISQEIDLVIKVKVEDIREKLELHDHEAYLLLNELTSTPNRTYLWVHLAFDVISQSLQIDKDSIQEIIRTLPQTAEAAYEKILNRSKYRNKARKILHIIIAATRPLSLEEMHVALAMAGDKQRRSLSEAVIIRRFSKELREICGLFVTVVDSRVYLLHQTCREFLIREEPADRPEFHDIDKPHLQWRNSFRLMESHRLLADICVQCLIFNDQGNIVLLLYAVESWTIHFRRANHMNTEETILQAKLLSDPTSSQCIDWLSIYKKEVNRHLPELFSSLMVASFFGLEHIVDVLLKNKKTILNLRNNNGDSALSLACAQGHDGIVRMLLSNKTTKVFERMLLSNKTAKVFERYGRLNMILRYKTEATSFVESIRNPFVNSRNSQGETPMCIAAGKGYASIVESLIRYKADVKHDVWHGRTPLLEAIEHGHIDVARLIIDELRRGSKPGSASNTFNYNAVEHAVFGGHMALVKLLLEPLAWVNGQEQKLNNLLCLAVEQKDAAIVSLLLENGAPVKSCGHTSAVTTSLETQNIRTILRETECIALRNDAVRLFRQSNGLSSLYQTWESHELCEGHTPFHAAAKMGSEEISRLLLENGVWVDTRDCMDTTPLHLAVRHGHVDTIRLLLESDAEPNVRNIAGNTPLHMAVATENEVVTRLLLEKGAEVNARNRFNETPLHVAAKFRAWLSRFLLEEGQVAAQNWSNEQLPHATVVKLLLDHGAQLNARNYDGFTPLDLSRQEPERPFR